MRIKNPQLQSTLKVIAKTIVREEGWNKLNVRNITKLANCATGTFYGYFQDLNELILAINKDSLEELIKLFETIDCEFEPEERIGAIAEAYINFSIERHHEWSMLFEYKLDPDYPIPSWYQELVTRVFSFIKNEVRSLVKEECLDAYSSLLWSNVHGLAVLHHSRRIYKTTEINIYEQLEFSVRNFLRGMEG